MGRVPSGGCMGIAAASLKLLRDVPSQPCQDARQTGLQQQRCCNQHNLRARLFGETAGPQLVSRSPGCSTACCICLPAWNSLEHTVWSLALTPAPARVCMRYALCLTAHLQHGTGVVLFWRWRCPVVHSPQALSLLPTESVQRLDALPLPSLPDTWVCISPVGSLVSSRPAP